MQEKTNVDLHDDDLDHEDENGLEREADTVPEIEVPFDPTKIDIIVKPMTISTLKDRLQNFELDLTPDFQRQAHVWNAKRKSRLLESILLRIPLPSFYFSEDADGGYAVVDGLQRLCSIFHFMEPKLLADKTGVKLPPLLLNDLQYLRDQDGKSFGDLDRKFQRRISELEITANIIRANTPPAVKFNVFARLNQGGMPLNAQEIRNAIFPGAWRNHLREMSAGDVFLNATDNAVRSERQQDVELILRFVSLWQLGPSFSRPAQQTLDEFLNSVVEESLVHWAETDWRKVKSAFENGLRAARAIFGRHAFRKSTGTGRRRPINRGLFEAELAVCSVLTDSQVARLVEKSDAVSDRFSAALKNDAEFIQALLYATGSAGASRARIKTITAIFKEALND